MDTAGISAVLFDFGGTLDADGLAWKERVYRLFRDEGVAVGRERFDPLFHAADDALVGTIPPTTSFDATVAGLVAAVAEGLGPADATFVGDSLPRDMAGARAVGMRHIWLVGGAAPAGDPCCRGDRVIHSLKDVEGLL